MLERFAAQLLSEVAEECEQRINESPELFSKVATDITEIIESLVESPED